ncbi:hypothetical protein GOC53_00830 [Sinorhizobium medicae]|nr:hypothetical protein [Sinorhizobium medicae]
MRFLWSGYGSGSQGASGEAKQYKTLRGIAHNTSNTISVSSDGVVSSGSSHPSLKIKGHTTKRSDESYNNEMSLIFWDMNKAECANMATAFLDFVRKANPSDKDREAFDELMEAFASYLVDYHSIESWVFVIEKISKAIGRDADRWDEMMSSAWERNGAVGEVWRSPTSPILREYANTLRNVVELYKRAGFQADLMPKGPKPVD